MLDTPSVKSSAVVVKKLVNICPDCKEDHSRYKKQDKKFTDQLRLQILGGLSKHNQEETRC